MLLLPISQKTYGRTFYEYRPRSTATFTTSSQGAGKEVRPRRQKEPRNIIKPLAGAGLPLQ